jgi:hypothetical protein
MQLTPLKSSNIAGAGFNDIGGLFVKFVGNPGPVYVYKDAQPEVYDELVAAESAGRFFAANIRSALKGTRLPEDEWADYIVPEEDGE